MATSQYIIDIRTRGTKKSSSDIKRIGQSAAAVRRTLAFMRAALVAVAAVRVFGRLASDLAAFSDSMSAVKAITGATNLEFQKLRETAKGLGATTRFTAAEAADGMAFLARAGFDVNEVLGTIPSTLNLASAGMLSLGNAADIASNLMTSFGLATSETTGVIDTLVFTANNSNTSVQQLADGLKLVAPIASGLGVSLEDAASAMAIMGDNGIQASLAGTGFRRVLTDLEAPTGSLLKVLKALNIPLGEVRPSVVGLTGALERLKEANVGASISSVLFGKRGGFVAAAMLRDVEKIKAFRLEQEKNGGTALRVAKIMEDNLAGSFRAVRSAIQAVIIAFGDLGAEEFLKDFFFGLADALRAVARHADDVAAAAKVLIAVFVTRKILLYSAALLSVSFNMLKMVAAALLAPGAFLKATFSVNGFAAALNRIPFIAFLTLLGVALAGLTAFRDEIKLAKGDAGTLADVFSTMGDMLDREFTDVINALGFEFKDFGEIAKAAVSGIARAIEDTIAVAFGLVAAIRQMSASSKLVRKQNLLNAKNDLLEYQTTANKVASNLGLDDVFNTNETKKDILELIIEVQKLNSVVADGGTVWASFVKGTREFEAARKVTTDARLIAERDAAILATEEANRRAAKARIVPFKPELDGGITLEDVGLPDAAAEKAATEIERLTEALRGLEAQYFPLLSVQNDEAVILKTISDARAKGIESLVSEEELLKRAARAQLGLGMTVEQAAEQQKVFKNALDNSIISLAEFNRLTRDLKLGLLDAQTDAMSGFERGLLRIAESAEDTASVVENAMTSAFDAANASFSEFLETGQFEFKDFARTILAELAKMLFQLLLFKAIAGIAGALGGGAIPAGSPGSSGSGGINPDAIPDMPEFAGGGSFGVGGSKLGVDNQVVAFRATPGERVTVETEQQQRDSDRASKAQEPSQAGDITIINVDDPNKVLDALSTTRGQRVLMNTMQRNRVAFRKALSI